MVSFTDREKKRTETDKDLTGKTAVITGSARGIGLEIAQTLAERGAKIMLSDMSPADDADISATLRTMKQEFGADNVAYTACDVTDYAQVEKLMQHTADFSGTGVIDLLVNNAGVQRVHRYDEFPVEDFNLVVNTNLKGVFHGMKAATPYLEKSADAGRIINIASVNGHVGSPNKIAYCAAKAAVIGMTKTAARDVENSGQRIILNSVSPGFLDTQLVRDQVDKIANEQDLSQAAAKDKLFEYQEGDYIPVSAVANTVANLTSMPAAKATKLNGQDLRMDGKWKDNYNERHQTEVPSKFVDRLMQSASQRSNGLV